MSSDNSSSWPIIHPRALSKNLPWIDGNFYKSVRLHVVKNYIPSVNPPLILSIQGNPGEGKSYQTREVCSQMGVCIVPMSGSTLSGSHEGDAVNIFQSAYMYASAVRESTNKMTVLLIDDFDLSVASTFSGVEYTVNSQLLVGFIMNIADDPNRCGSKKTSRIPLIFTGNDFTSLRSSLTRHGRMNFFDWNPSVEQKINMVRAMFVDVIHKNDYYFVDNLVKSYERMPISFYSSIKEDIIDDFIDNIITRDNSISITSIEKQMTRKFYTIDEVKRAAAKRAEAFAKNYIIAESRNVDPPAPSPQPSPPLGEGAKLPSPRRGRG